MAGAVTQSSLKVESGEILKPTKIFMKESELQVIKQRRLMSANTLKDLQKAARKNNVTEGSLIWLLTPTFSNGAIRSHSFSDAPNFVISDGLVVERLDSGLSYTPWAFTTKAESILEKTT